MNKRNKIDTLFMLFSLLVLLLLIFPLYKYGNSATPLVLGLPFSLFWVAKLSFRQQLELHQVGNKPSGKYNFSKNKKRKKFKSLLFERCFIS